MNSRQYLLIVVIFISSFFYLGAGEDDIQSPVIDLVSPSNNAVFPENELYTYVKVNFYDDTGIKSIFLNNNLIEHFSSNPPKSVELVPSPKSAPSPTSIISDGALHNRGLPG